LRCNACYVVSSVPGTMFRVVEEPPDVGVPFDDPDLGGFAVRG
jgi:hypothetical protein